jgi:cytoskeletal protein CcmA (bactofilin family)
MGEVSGDVIANTLTLKTACSVVGNIFHDQLLHEDGSYFEGKSRRLPNPLKNRTVGPPAE